MAETGYGRGAVGAVQDNLGLLPVAHRARAAVALVRSGNRPWVRDLVPEWMLPGLAGSRRRAMSWWQGWRPER
jgi:hypothetical protein